MTDVLDRPAEAAAPEERLEQAEAFDIPEAPKEKLGRFADPRDETRRILQERLDRVLQPVDDDDVWHGVNVVTAKDLHAAIALDLPPASIFSASVRTPAYLYVSAVCPICSIVSEIPLVIGVKVTVEGSSRKLELTKEAKAMPHQCGQQRLDDLAPSRPAQMSIDDVEAAEDEDEAEDQDDVEDGLAEGVRILTEVPATATESTSARPVGFAPPAVTPDDRAAELECVGSNHVPGHTPGCPDYGIPELPF